MSQKSGKKAPIKILCPNCRKETTWEGNPDRPFCSERCQLIDRGAWAEGKYTIPAEDAPGVGEGEEED